MRSRVWGLGWLEVGAKEGNGSFRSVAVPDFVVLIIRILLFRVPY